MVKEIMEKNRSPYNTTIENDLIKKLKFLSVDLNKRQNDLLEEAIEDLLKKYESPKVKKK
jgi:hypothetical protein